MRGHDITLFPPLLRSDQAELLDEPAAVRAELPDNLREIRRLNQWLGGTKIAVSALSRLHCGNETAISLLDIATGSADIPLAYLRLSRRSGHSVRITALDNSNDVLVEARKVTDGESIELVLGDARALPFPPRAFDVVSCCLALHHFSDSDAVKVLSEMWRVARKAIVVVDLARSYPALAGTWMATRIVAHNRLTRHDGPLSVRKAFTCQEMSTLAVRAGIEKACVRRHMPFRQSLLAIKGETLAS